MTQKEIFIIKAIWGSDFQGSKNDVIKQDIIRSVNKRVNCQNSPQTEN